MNFPPFLRLQKMGVEPTRYCYHTDLNRARLPIPPLLHLAAFTSNEDYYNGYKSYCPSFLIQNVSDPFPVSLLFIPCQGPSAHLKFYS